MHDDLNTVLPIGRIGQIGMDALGSGPLLSPPDSRQTLRQQVFETIRAEGQTSRADITRALSVSPGSVTALTSDLIGLGLIEEVETPARDSDQNSPRETTSRGRPRVGLAVVADAYRVIGIKIGDQSHTAVMSDFAGNALAEVSRTARTGVQTPLAQLDEIDALLTDLTRTTGTQLADVAAIGVGIAGMVDHSLGVVAWSPRISARDYPLKAVMEQRFGRPVHVDNDANMLTLAELWFGAGRAMQDFVVVTIEHGVGMGMVLGNRLFRGTRGMGLELGHTKVQFDGALCRCGQRGCLEAYVADYALVREAATVLSGSQTTDPRALLAQLYKEATEGNAAARAIFDRASRYLAMGLSNVMQILDPELLIISGERMQYDYLYSAEMQADVEALVLDSGRPAARIETHAWGDMIWARGASALALTAVTDQLLGDGA